MIGFLRGAVRALREGERGCEALVEVGGIGYRTAVTPSALARLAKSSGEITLHTHLHVREDEQALYGFETEEERDVFETLIGASGVGPKVALAILATHSPRSLRKLVAAGDAGALTLVPGIGRKTAQKLLLELGDRLGVPSLETVTEVGDLPAGDVRAALAGLGYGPTEIRDAMADLEAGDNSEEMLREALRRLGDRVREA